LFDIISIQVMLGVLPNAFRKEVHTMAFSVRTLGLAVFTSLALAVSAGAAYAQDSTVQVVHGIPGQDLGADPALPVDVYVSVLGCVLRDFRFGDVSPTLTIPADTYDIEVRISDGACGGAVAISAPGVTFEADQNATVIAHLSEVGEPTASVFVNDLSPSEEKEGRVGLAHTAAAPAVDIRLYGGPYWFWKPALRLDDVTNGASAESDLREGLYLATIAPAGGKPIYHQFLYIREATSLLVYAVGTAGTSSFQLLSTRLEQVVEPPGDPAVVTVIHGIPGIDLGLPPEANPLPVDVYVSDVGCVLKGFTLGSVSPRLELEAGSYDIEVLLSDGACGGDLAFAVPGVPFEPGENATVVAHLTEDGAPTASKFTNDLEAVRYWRKGKLAVHHLAAAPAVDIDVFRRVWRYLRHVLSLESVVNGDSATAELRRGIYRVEISPAGGSPIFDAGLWVPARRSTLVYAVGSLANGTFQLIVDRQPLEH
jgi:hypothetical protein